MPLDDKNWQPTVASRMRELFGQNGERWGRGRFSDAPAKADPFTLDSLIAWLETMPADRVYNFFDCDGMCLIGQYIAAKSSSNHWRHYGYPNWMDLVDAHPHVSKIATHEPFTFGAALLRARALKAQGA